jgi:uncharacterized protein YbbC (DUF1343 family)
MMAGGQPIRNYWLALSSVCCVIVVVFYIPQFFISHFQRPYEICNSTDAFKLGLENISQDFLRALTARHDLSFTVALITNRTGKDQIGNRNIDILLEKGLNIKKIFVPFDDGCSETTSQKRIDHATRIPIINLQGRRINNDDLKGIEVIFFDIQDVGIRFSGSLGPLVNLMEVAGRLDKTVVVLDRPNLLGAAMEGAFGMTDIQQSLVASSVPIRYGMTIGELALYCNKKVLKKAAQVYVVPMDNYNRQLHPYKTVIGSLSPNIHSIESCHGYSFLGLLGEVAPFDIGIGTDRAFQCILLPEHICFTKKQWFKLKDELKELGIDSMFYKYYSQRKKEICSGLRVSILDISNFSLFKALVTTLDFFKGEGIELKFSENFSAIPGMNLVKELVAGNIDRKDFQAKLKSELDHFFVVASGSFMYKPYPKVISS